MKYEAIIGCGLYADRAKKALGNDTTKVWLGDYESQTIHASLDWAEAFDAPKESIERDLHFCHDGYRVYLKTLGGNASAFAFEIRGTWTIGFLWTLVQVYEEKRKLPDNYGWGLLPEVENKLWRDLFFNREARSI